MPTEAEKATALERLRKGEAEDIAKVRERYASAYRDLGIAAPSPANNGGSRDGVKDKVTKIDEDADLFHKMSPADLLDLYKTNPSRHQELLDAVEAMGRRRLGV